MVSFLGVVMRGCVDFWKYVEFVCVVGLWWLVEEDVGEV